MCFEQNICHLFDMDLINDQRNTCCLGAGRLLPVRRGGGGGGGGG